MKEIKNPFDQHIFVCTNTKSDGKGCASIGGEKIREALKSQAAKIRDKNIRVNKSGCLGFCENGPVVVVYPEGKIFVEVEEEVQTNDFNTN